MAATLAAGCLFGGRPHQPLETVASVDLARYMGTWHEIARLPASFQEGCYATTADYTLRPDGRVEVINRCRRGSPEGPMDEARGIAKAVDGGANARLKVSFFRPFWGDYWILALGPDYEYAVVGTPDRTYLWILAREPAMEEGLYRSLVEMAAARGFDTSRLIRS